MNKKLFALLLVFSMMMIALVGCAQNDEQTDVNNNKGTQKQEQTAVNNDENTKKVEAVDVKKVFVTPEWVKNVIDGEQAESKKYVILEASWGSADESPDYNKGHIPGAVHVDIASIEGEPYWNIKTPEEVEQAMLDMGVTKDTTVILYGADVSGTARVAYAYLWAGVDNVKVLDGGLNAWTKAGFDLETTPNLATAATEFGAEVPVHPEYWISIDDVEKKLAEDSNFKLVSIRSYDEFIGKTSGYSYIDKAGEPKGAVWGKAGSDPYHMEGYTHEDGTYITMDEMKELWKDLDFTLDNDLAFYCGTGWRASIPFLIMYENGYTNMSMYDGGWYQWQMNDDLPVQVGDPKNGNVEYTTVGKLSNDKAAK
jgi:molybdopterin synthase sulfurtransferase